MIELLEIIKSTHLERISDINFQREVWFKLSGLFKPDISLYRAGRPSSLIAKETGDLGLSVLWIVQSALIRPILKEIVLRSPDNADLSAILNKVNHNSLCALAHSESPAAPVLLSQSADKYILNGEKKFITAGKNAGLMIVTCRYEGEEKISHIAIINPAELPGNSLPDLNLDIMRSVSHTKLVLNNTVIQPFQVPDIAPSAVRKMIKKYGILERAMILEAFLSFLLYSETILNTLDAGISASEEIHSLLELQTVSVTKQIDEAVYNDKIETQNMPMQRLFPLIETFKKAYIKTESALNETERIKLKDLFMFDSLKG